MGHVLRFSEEQYAELGKRRRERAPERTETAKARPRQRDQALPVPLDLLYPFIAICRAAGLHEPVPEYQFHPSRKWRFDYAFPMQKIAIEVEGGVWTEGRHTRGSGFLSDMEKYNAAALLGWRLLRYTPQNFADAILDLRQMWVPDGGEAA